MKAMRHQGAGERAQWLTAVVALAEKPGWVPSTYMATHNQHQLTPGLGEQMASSGLHAHQAHTLYTDIYADNTHMDIIYIKILTRHQYMPSVIANIKVTLKWMARR